LKYRNYIIANSQLNGNFYGLFPVDLEERIFITPGRREWSADNEENEDVPHGRLIGFHSSGTGTTMPG
jgi:hypothetical protein